MQTYHELEELAVMCASNSWAATSTAVAVELWNMAQEYQEKAAQLRRCLTLASRRPGSDNPVLANRPVSYSGLTRRRA
jgi:hypothetical protein